MTSDGTVTSSTIQSNALAIFNANRHTSGDTAIPNFTIAIQKAGNTITSVVTASGTFKPSFLGLIGQGSIKLAATSNASDNYAPFVNFNILLDNSPSMAIPASATDITRMINMTKTDLAEPSCAFACHATDPNYAAENLSTFASQPTDGGAAILTRIQVVQQSVQQLYGLASNIEQQNGVPKEFNMAVYDFGAQAMMVQGLTNYIPLSSDLSPSNAAKANSIDVMSVPSENQTYNGGNNDEDTSLSSMLSQLYLAVDPTGGPAGSGVTSTSPQQVIFLVSDGVDDSYDPTCTYNDGQPCRETRPIGLDSNICNAIKSKGISIAVLYTTYVPLDDPSNPPIDPVTKKPKPSWYDLYVAPYQPQIASAMQACASPGLYSEVSPNQAIPTAMTNLFQKVVASVKIMK